MTPSNLPQRKIHVSYESGRYQLQGIPSRLQEKCDAFFELSLARGLAIRTIRAYAFDLSIYFRFRRPELHPFRKTTHREVAEFIKTQRSRGAAPSSINRRLNSVEVFYRYCFNSSIPLRIGVKTDAKSRSQGAAARRGERFLGYDSNLGVFPIYKKAGRTLRVRVPQHQIKPLSSDEVQRFIAALQCYRDRAMTLLMLFSGLRLSEVLDLKLNGIDRTTNEIRFIGKGAKTRVVPIAPLALDFIDRYIALERPVRTGLNEEDRIFLVLNGNQRGKRLSAEGLRSIFRVARDTSGVKHANPHRFRHTFAANLAAQGVSILVIQYLLGHSDIRTSLKYTWLFPQHVHSEFNRANVIHQKNYESLSSSPA